MDDSLFNAKCIIISIDKKDSYYEEGRFMLLFPYLFRFERKNDCTLVMGETQEIKGAILQSFIQLIQEAFEALLQDCYVEPSLKDKQRKHSYYERFLYQGKKYVVNYRTTVEGNLMFFLSHKIVALQEALDSGKRVTLKIE